jgi:hypothetical protein
MFNTILNKSRIPMQFILTIFSCYSNFDLNLFATETEDKSTDKCPEYARFEFLTTVLPGFRGYRKVLPEKLLPKWTNYLNILYNSSVCFLNFIEWPHFTDGKLFCSQWLFRTTGMYQEEKQTTDASKFPPTSNFLKRPPWILWSRRWRHYDPVKMSKVKIPKTKCHNNPPGQILVVASRKTEGRTDMTKLTPACRNCLKNGTKKKERNKSKAC